jgi:hypothetical protein
MSIGWIHRFGFAAAPQESPVLVILTLHLSASSLFSAASITCTVPAGENRCLTPPEKAVGWKRSSTKAAVSPDTTAEGIDKVSRSTFPTSLMDSVGEVTGTGCQSLIAQHNGRHSRP